jgi:uncharacterized protein YcaQ
MRITREQARRFLILYHGLGASREFKGKQGIADYIRRVGCIQFDPLDIVGCNPELVLQARIKGFKPEMLYDLLYKDRVLIDGMDKNMSIYPILDWPCFERVRRAHREWYPSRDDINAVEPAIVEEFRKRGSLSSSDLDFGRAVDWYWAPTSLTRAAMESMFYSGKIVIHHKKRTRRFYDLAEKVIPAHIFNQADPNQTPEEYADWRVLRRIGGIGLLWNRAGDGWLGICNLKSADRGAAIERLLAAGKLDRVDVDGINTPLYMRSEFGPLMEKVLQDAPASNRAIIMAPLDNLLWERRLLLELFDFDYRWEVYKPKKDRQFGYYVLPVLFGDRFVARLEPGRDRKANRFIIKNWWWEPGVRVTKRLEAAIERCLLDFKDYLGVDEVNRAAYDQALAGKR